MTEQKISRASVRVIEMLPKGLGDEILRIASSRRGGVADIREIRLRREGACSMLLGCENIRLARAVGREEWHAVLDRLTGGALYAHRDSIASGYVSLGDGIRVGVCGCASYDGDRLVGIKELTSLIFRIPSGRCDFADELYSVFCDGIGCGMLIYSPPGVGKTTALRSLASSIGGGRKPMRVAVVDERCEFSHEDYSGCEVDILCGYKRREGIEIATRTVSCDIIMIDELGADDCAAILDVVRCGVPLVATAHAYDFDEVMAKPALRPLINCGVFSVFVGISRRGGVYTLSVDRL